MHVLDKARKSCVEKIEESERLKRGEAIVLQKSEQLSSSRFSGAIERIKSNAGLKSAVQSRVSDLELRAKESIHDGFQNLQAEFDPDASLWEKGFGHIWETKKPDAPFAWQGNGEDTLQLNSSIDHWKRVDVKDVEEYRVPRAKVEMYAIDANTLVHFAFRVKEAGTAFSLNFTASPKAASPKAASPKAASRKTAAAKAASQNSDKVPAPEEIQCEQELVPVTWLEPGQLVVGSWLCDTAGSLKLTFLSHHDKERWCRRKKHVVAFAFGTSKPNLLLQMGSAGQHIVARYGHHAQMLASMLTKM